MRAHVKQRFRYQDNIEIAIKYIVIAVKFILKLALAIAAMIIVSFRKPSTLRPTFIRMFKCLGYRLIITHVQFPLVVHLTTAMLNLPRTVPNNLTVRDLALLIHYR